MRDMADQLMAQNAALLAGIPGNNGPVDRFGKNWSPEEERTLLDAYREHGPNWAYIESLLPLRKGIVSKWKRLVATGHEEAISVQRYWRQARERQAVFDNSVKKNGESDDGMGSSVGHNAAGSGAEVSLGLGPVILQSDDHQAGGAAGAAAGAGAAVGGHLAWGALPQQQLGQSGPTGGVKRKRTEAGPAGNEGLPMPFVGAMGMGVWMDANGQLVDEAAGLLQLQAEDGTDGRVSRLPLASLGASASPDATPAAAIMRQHQLASQLGGSHLMGLGPVSSGMQGKPNGIGGMNPMAGYLGMAGLVSSSSSASSSSSSVTAAAAVPTSSASASGGSAAMPVPPLPPAVATRQLSQQQQQHVVDAASAGISSLGAGIHGSQQLVSSSGQQQYGATQQQMQQHQHYGNSGGGAGAPLDPATAAAAAMVQQSAMKTKRVTLAIDVPIPTLPAHSLPDPRAAEQWMSQYAETYAEHYAHAYAKTILEAYYRGYLDFLQLQAPPPLANSVQHSLQQQLQLHAMAANSNIAGGTASGTAGGGGSGNSSRASTNSGSDHSVHGSTGGNTNSSGSVGDGAAGSSSAAQKSNPLISAHVKLAVNGPNVHAHDNGARPLPHHQHLQQQQPFVATMQPVAQPSNPAAGAGQQVYYSDPQQQHQHEQVVAHDEAAGTPLSQALQLHLHRPGAENGGAYGAGAPTAAAAVADFPGPGDGNGGSGVVGMQEPGAMEADDSSGSYRDLAPTAIDTGRLAAAAAAARAQEGGGNNQAAQLQARTAVPPIDPSASSSAAAGAAGVGGHAASAATAGIFAPLSPLGLLPPAVAGAAGAAGVAYGHPQP